MSNEEWKRFYYNDKPTNYMVSSFGRFYNTKKQHISSMVLIKLVSIIKFNYGLKINQFYLTRIA